VGKRKALYVALLGVSVWPASGSAEVLNFCQQMAALDSSAQSGFSDIITGQTRDNRWTTGFVLTKAYDCHVFVGRSSSRREYTCDWKDTADYRLSYHQVASAIKSCFPGSNGDIAPYDDKDPVAAIKTVQSEFTLGIDDDSKEFWLLVSKR
jgi:hypothetical protein